MFIALDLDLLTMDDPVSMISRSGATGTLIAEFRALSDATDMGGAPKYAPKPVLHGLARFITGASGGPNKDSELFELCHLIAILARMAPGTDARAEFFLGITKAAASIFRATIHGYGDPGDGISVDDGGVNATYGDGEFGVRYGRMPLLAALYEFLIASDGFENYQPINDVFDGLNEGAASVRDIQDSANALSSIVRQYRRKHIQRSKYDDKFNAILTFLRARTVDNKIHVDDETVLDFWVSNNDAGDFRVYKTVFEGFVEFMKSFEMGGRTDAVERSAVIGTDFEAHEVEPDDQAGDIFSLSDWQSPLAVLAEGAAADIKFFKKESEQKPIEALMQYGPYAERLAMAFLRLESFGPIQAGITNDLQVKRGRASIETRITCDDAFEYRDKVAGFEAILDHVKQLQKAAYHVLTSGAGQAGNVVSLFGDAPETSFEA
ncbi:MAG: hypothetical protein HOB64_06585, partial [Rhodospirillaceae bacterium]|nr:hypothetical protein [Rhodospirillaceae bacterium]MBT4671765.1 hypothetical protein [Rhodospirillaceae bacterium]